jgi:hypothetical protein
MEQVSGNGVQQVNVLHTGELTPCHLVSTFIHHELTPERERELAHIIEVAIMDAVKVWCAS